MLLNVGRSYNLIERQQASSHEAMLKLVCASIVFCRVIFIYG